MPNRILKESICTSDNIDELTTFQENVFYRLLVCCDDFGRMDARPKILASKLYPLKSIRADQMADALRALSSAELVTLYEVGGKPFLQMKTWERHQQIRAKRSKYPGPENSNLISSDINCNQMISDDCICPRNPIQSESEYENPNPKSNPNTNSSSAGAFEEFWAAYPRKVGKSDAQKAFAKVKVPVQVLIEAINKQKTTEQWCKDGGKFIPYPATWLNGGRWQDEVSVKKSSLDVASYEAALENYFLKFEKGGAE